eukprot:6859307-Prymnesium_polylepis.1
MLQANRIPLLSYTKVDEVSKFHEFDFLVPCCYDPIIDHLCAARDEYPRFHEREPIAFGSYAERCPYKNRFAPLLRDYDNKELPQCPRKYYWELAQNHSDTLDVRLHGQANQKEDDFDKYEYRIDAGRDYKAIIDRLRSGGAQVARKWPPAPRAARARPSQ